MLRQIQTLRNILRREFLLFIALNGAAYLVIVILIAIAAVLTVVILNYTGLVGIALYGFALFVIFTAIFYGFATGLAVFFLIVFDALAIAGNQIVYLCFGLVVSLVLLFLGGSLRRTSSRR